MFRISNHGGHSAEFCDHAVSGDTTRKIIESYAQNEFRQVAITEHLPPPDDRFLYPDEKQLLHSASFLRERFKGYAASWPELHAEFDRRLTLFLGFETEYYGLQPQEHIRRAIEEHRPEIVVASIHHVDDMAIDFDQAHYNLALAASGGVENLYERYYQQQKGLIDCLAPYTSEFPVVLGHLDLIKIFSPDKNFTSDRVRGLIEVNIEAAVAAGMIIEVNARAFRKQLSEPYPSVDLIRLVNQMGGKLTIGDDSHGADQVGLFYPDTYRALKAAGVTEIAGLTRDPSNKYKISSELL